MTATCTLCGTLITAEPDTILDSQRDDRTFGRLGATFQAHMLKFHAAEPQQAIDMQPPLPLQAFLGLAPAGKVALGVVAMTAQGIALFSYLESQDPIFNGKTETMREVVRKSIEQKQPAQLVKP